MSEKQQRSGRGDKRHFKKPVRTGAGNSGLVHQQKEYKRVISPAETKTGGGDTSTTTSSRSLTKFHGQGRKSRDEPRTTSLENDTPPESSAAFDVPHSDAPPIKTDKQREDSHPNSVSGDFEPAASITPIRDGTSREVSLRFGSVAPCLANGMKIPPKTSAAPPNPDEERWKQANYTAFRPKNIVAPLQSRDIKQSMNEVSPQTHLQRTMHSHLQSPVATSTMSSSLASPGVPMNVPRQQSHIPVQYGMHGPRMQAPGVSPTSHQMPIPLTMGGPSQVRHPSFVPGLPPHLAPLPHAPLHQGQGFNFPPQIGHQLSPQTGSSIGIAPRFPQHHITNLSPRRAVKITHPNTLEELKLDERPDSKLDTGSSGPGSHHNSGFQLPPIPYNHSHPMNYYPHVNPAPVILKSPPSIPPASNSGTSNLRFNSPGMHGMIVSPELSIGAGRLIPNNPAAVMHMAGNSDCSSNNEINQGILQEPPSLHNSQKEESKVRTENSFESSKLTANAAPYVIPSPRTAEYIAPLSSDDTAMDNINGFLKNKQDNMSNHRRAGKKSEDTTSSLKSLKTKEKTIKDLSIAEPSFGKEQAALQFNKNDQGIFDTANLKTDSANTSLRRPVSSSEQSNVESSKMGASLSGSGFPDDEESSPSDNSGESYGKSQSNSKLTVYRVKNETTKGKKKRKELLQKADAVSSTSDPSMAFNGLHKKSGSTVTSETTGSFSRKGSSNFSERDIAGKDNPSKLEPDDWDTAGEMSSPKLENCNETEVLLSKHGITPKGKKYSRDFLLSLSQKFTKIPPNFRIAYDFREALLDPEAIMPIDVGHNMFSGYEQITEKQSGVLRRSPGSHGNGLTDDGRWNKSAKSVSSCFEPRMDASHRGNNFGFRSGQGGTQGSFRSPRGQASGLAHPVSQGGTRNNGPDADRWNASRVQKVASPVQVMHKAEKKYKIRNVSDAEEAKHRQLKAILNKLTPQNFERLFEQVKEVRIDNAETLSGVIAQIFDKALMEPTFCEMYADFCYHLAGELPDFIENDQKITFKRLLLNKCQEEFERGEREQSESDRDEGEVKLSEQEREEKRISAKRKMLGNIRLIGELYKKKMLTERIMHECIQKLLGQYQNTDEENIESLCKLMSTIGEMIEHPKAREYMDSYFEIMTNLSNNMNLSSRVRFMLKDVIELRENKWQQRRKVEGPKKIEELHRDAAQERQASRMTRGSGFTSSRRGQNADFGHRKPNIFSPPSPQMGSVRGMPPPVAGFGNQDVRLEERGPTDNRILPVPLSHRPTDTQVSLGSKGGLAKGLHGRGPPVLSGPPRMDLHSSYGEFRGTPGSKNVYNSMADWRPYSTNHEPMKRPQEKFTRVQPHRQGHLNPLNSELMNLALSPGRPETGHVQRLTTLNNLSGKAHSEEQLNKMSMEAIKEFYSARDENELIMCVKDLNAPSFHPAMISLWVNDSFERKNYDRDLLARLLIKLTKSREGILNTNQLSDGFRLVLANLEDAVTDAPKATIYLGRIFGRIVIESAISLSGICSLLQQGGAKPGQLIQNMIGFEVLENALEVIKLEKGESSLEEMCKNSNICLEEFRRPGTQVKQI